MKLEEPAFKAATEALLSCPLNISSTRRSGQNGLMNANEVVRGVIEAWEAAKPQGEQVRTQEVVDLLNLGWELSTWAGCINWRGGRNEKEWLDDLRSLVERFQTGYKATLAALPSALEQAGWMDIRTAPKDGSEFLGYGRLPSDTESQPLIAFYDDGGFAEGFAEKHRGNTLYLSHWMPLPASPGSEAPEQAAREIESGTDSHLIFASASGVYVQLHPEARGISFTLDAAGCHKSKQMIQALDQVVARVENGTDNGGWHGFR